MKHTPISHIALKRTADLEASGGLTRIDYGAMNSTEQLRFNRGEGCDPKYVITRAKVIAA